MNPDIDARIPSEAQIGEIESKIQQQEQFLADIKPVQKPMKIPGFDDFEERIKDEYRSRLSAQERTDITFNARKTFEDSKYEGDLLRNRRHGLGRMEYENGRWYFGEWKEDLRHGRGIEQYSNRNKYMGDFETGKATGMGIYIWSNGEVY